MGLEDRASWETFYVIVGGSGAALTGLMFVVIALTAEARRKASALGLRAFATPTIFHFTMVLVVSALIAIPHRSVAGLVAELATLGVAGAVYTLVAMQTMRRQTDYVPVVSDWAYFAFIPLAAYLGIVAAALVAISSVGAGLEILALAVLSLLVIGIHNAWDAAVHLANQRGDS